MLDHKILDILAAMKPKCPLCGVKMAPKNKKPGYWFCTRVGCRFLGWFTPDEIRRLTPPTDEQIWDGLQAADMKSLTVDGDETSTVAAIVDEFRNAAWPNEHGGVSGE